MRRSPEPCLGCYGLPLYSTRFIRRSATGSREDERGATSRRQATERNCYELLTIAALHSSLDRPASGGVDCVSTLTVRRLGTFAIDMGIIGILGLERSHIEPLQLVDWRQAKTD